MSEGGKFIGALAIGESHQSEAEEFEAREGGGKARP